MGEVARKQESKELSISFSSSAMAMGSGLRVGERQTAHKEKGKGERARQTQRRKTSQAHSRSLIQLQRRQHLPSSRSGHRPRQPTEPWLTWRAWTLGLGRSRQGAGGGGRPGGRRTHPCQQPCPCTHAACISLVSHAAGEAPQALINPAACRLLHCLAACSPASQRPWLCRRTASLPTCSLPATAHRLPGWVLICH